MKPTFPHNCDACILLGADVGHDYYFCPRCDGGTLVSRYGEVDREYFSLPADIVMMDVNRFLGKPMGVCLNLALLRGMCFNKEALNKRPA